MIKYNLVRLQTLFISMLLIACQESATKQSTVAEANLESYQNLKIQIDSIIAEGKNTEIYVAVSSQPDLFKITDEEDLATIEWPEDTEATYNIIRDDQNRAVSFIEYPFSHSGDWSASMAHYFDKSGKTVISYQRYGAFNVDAGDPFFAGGEFYRSSLLKYFDTDLKEIWREYSLTDDNDRELVHPSGEGGRIMIAYFNSSFDSELGKVFRDYKALLTGKNLN